MQRLFVKVECELNDGSNIITIVTAASSMLSQIHLTKTVGGAAHQPLTPLLPPEKNPEFDVPT